MNSKRASTRGKITDPWESPSFFHYISSFRVDSSSAGLGKKTRTSDNTIPKYREVSGNSVDIPDR
jgi:hypothetical protein